MLFSMLFYIFIEYDCCNIQNGKSRRDKMWLNFAYDAFFQEIL